MYRIKIISIILVIGGLSLSHCNAQDNVVKIAPLALIGKTVKLSYERVLADNQSVSASIGFVIPKKLPFFSVYESMLSDDLFVSYSSTFTGISALADYRIYTGADRRDPAPNGFYVAPYIAFSNYDIKLGIDDQLYEANFKAGFFHISGGISIGRQWIINDVISIDWTFLGLGIASYTFDGKYETNELGIDYSNVADDALSELDGLPIIGDKVDFNAGEDFLEAKAKFLLPELRGSLTLGIAF